ncbi:MAG: hypothetical protein RJA83_105 [Pseudomonadota bacterium]
MSNLEQQPASEKRFALLIEDDLFCQKVQSHCLYELGYTVELVTDAATAIERVEHNVYHLIVLDLGLPDQSGELVIRAVREFVANQQTPLIVATAHQASRYAHEKFWPSCPQNLFASRDLY